MTAPEYRENAIMTDDRLYELLDKIQTIGPDSVFDWQDVLLDTLELWAALSKYKKIVDEC